MGRGRGVKQAREVLGLGQGAVRGTLISRRKGGHWEVVEFWEGSGS